MTIRHSLANGFTVPELLIAVSVTAMISLVVTGYTVRNIQQSTVADVRATYQREVGLSLDLAANDIRQSANADAANRWADANSPNGATNQYSWASNSSTLILASAAQDSGGSILFSDSKNYVTYKNNIIYFLNNKILYKRTIAATVTGNIAKTSCPTGKVTTSCPADKELLHDVSTFNISYLDAQNQSVNPDEARSIELHVITSRLLYNKTVSADYTTRMVFRND